MKSNRKTKIIILIILGILFAFLPIFFSNLNFENSEFSSDNEISKISAVSGKIHIDGNSGWAAFRAAGNCTGSGNYTHPYVIEDLVIDGESSGSCILIENSDVYFRIENCTVYNGDPYGFRLSDVSNSLLIDNNCSFNSHYGISLWGTNNTLSGNTVNNNGGDGIFITGNDNTLSGNTINNNKWNGIELNWELTHNNNLLGNTANNNGNGIFLFQGCRHNNISGNIANNNGHGIFLSQGCRHNNISGNIANNNGHGIELNFECDSNILSGNTINDGDYGIYIIYSDYNIISGNTMNECGLLVECEDLASTASNFVDTTNLVNGKPLYYYYNEVNLGLTDFTNAGQVVLLNCKDSIIANLNVSYGSIGISLFYGSDNNTVSGNTVNYNKYGIYLYQSSYNNISGNTLIGNNECIVEEECQGNVFENNDCGGGGGIIPGYNLFLSQSFSIKNSRNPKI